MIAVLFEVSVHPDRQSDYLDAAALLRPELDRIDGFIAIERFESLSQPGRLLSLSWWRDQQSVAQWRNLDVHRRIQSAGRAQMFIDYRIRVAEVVRDYGMHQRAQAPQDSQVAHTPADAIHD